MMENIEVVGDLLSLLFFLQGIAAFSFLSLLPDQFDDVASSLRFLNLHFSPTSSFSSSLLNKLSVDRTCDDSGVFILNLLSIGCVFGCILIVRSVLYFLSLNFKACPLFHYPSLEIVAFMSCFFGISLSAAAVSTQSCTGLVIRIIAIVVLVVLCAIVLFLCKRNEKGLNGGMQPPSPLAEINTDIVAAVYFRYTPLIVMEGNKNFFESSEDITFANASKFQRFQFWAKSFCCPNVSGSRVGAWEKPEVLSRLLRVSVDDPALISSLDIGDVMALDFDLRKVVSLVGPKRTFALVAIKLFRRNGFIVESQAAKLHKNRDMVSFCTSSTFFHWVGAVEKGYLNHPYHNSVHATDVMCASNSYLIHSGLHSRINNASFGGGGGFDNLSWQLAQFSLLVAAAVHDIGHIGVSNAYLKSVNHPLCIEYPDTIGVLEAMHAATALAIFRTPGNNILECMSNANAQLVRENIVELVLVTDLSKQADFLKKWNARRTPPPEGSNAKGKWDILLEGSSPKASEDRMLFLKLMLKAADVSNPVKNTDLYLFWTDNIIEEFYRQGDMEREAGLPVTTMPNCDRNQPGLAQGQIGFLSFMVKPTYDAIMLFLNDQPPPKRRSSLGWGGKDSSSSRLDPVMANLDTNLAFWKNMKLSPEEASKVRFPRDLPERYLTQAQRNVFGSKTETETLQSEDELAKEFERQKVALVSRSAQSWMDDASCLPSAESTTEERDALASEFERQRLGGKPRSPQISFFERSAQRSDFFMDTYSLLFIRFTPHGRHFYSLDMIRKLLFAVTIALTSSPQSHKMRLLQTLLALIIALGWTIFQMVDIVCCRYWVSRVELLSSLVIVVMLAVVLVWIDSDEDVDSPHSNSLSDMLILIFLVCFGIDILFLAIDQAFIQRLCTMPKRNVNSYNNQDLEGGDDVRISLELPTSTSESTPAPEDQAQAAEDSKMVRRLSFDKINLSTLPTSSQVQEITKTTPKKTTKKKNKTSPFNKMEEPSTSEIDAVVEVAVKHTFGSRL